DTFFPVAKGGTFCVPGPFGAGKTVLQQLISRNADVDVVIIAACGERAGEVVETLREFPAYLESVIAKFYERGGIVKLNDGSVGSVTIGGTVSPAGGNFDEPVTQATLKVVGAFHGLSRERSDARRYPAINPLDSWSKYASIVPHEALQLAQKILQNGNDINQMMKVVGEEGTSVEDFVVYLKSEYIDAAYMQQNAFNEVDGATPEERQKYVFGKIVAILKTEMAFRTKAEARTSFQGITQVTKDWNRATMDSDEFRECEARLDKLVEGVKKRA
ncbi:MAG TPA: hypothetical protein VJ440_07105, partial [Candidatus Brocadiaceae bacterium]|nr:hypothetical protein [Candidatus Brocadiaceae bacterium]